ncbi:putative reverse transcriptase domain-containing protein [Tanacetum coccineum]
MIWSAQHGCVEDRRAHARYGKTDATATYTILARLVVQIDGMLVIPSRVVDHVRALKTDLMAKQRKVSRATRSTPATTTATTTTVTNAQLKAMIDQGVTNALVMPVKLTKLRIAKTGHNSGTGVRRTKRVARECTYPDFMKCQPLNFKGTEGVVELIQWCSNVKMNDKYCPRGEMKKLKVELWNLKVKESDKIERYVGGLPDMIHRSVVASKPKTMQDAIEMATELMDKKIRTFAERQIENKRKQDDNQQQQQHQQNKRQNTGRAYTRECPKLKNNNPGNQGGNGNAPAKVYAVGRVGTNPDSNVVIGTFLRNNRYASVLFDTGADRSFMSTTFSSNIDIPPSTLDHYFDVELADERINGLNAIIRGCTLNFLNHPFNLDLMLVELGSLDVIIGIDWLAKYKAIIVCAKKIVRIPWGNETLIVHGDGSNRGNETRLNIISCTKTQKYMLKGCLIFLAHVTIKETEDKSEKKRLEDISIVRDFPKVFPEDLLGLSPT